MRNKFTGTDGQSETQIREQILEGTVGNIKFESYNDQKSNGVLQLLLPGTDPTFLFRLRPNLKTCCPSQKNGKKKNSPPQRMGRKNVYAWLYHPFLVLRHCTKGFETVTSRCRQGFVIGKVYFNSWFTVLEQCQM